MSEGVRCQQPIYLDSNGISLEDFLSTTGSELISFSIYAPLFGSYKSLSFESD
jgi:hypothetical protein